MPPTKIFIDSAFRKDGTNSNFSFGLPRPVEINKQYKCYIDQVHVAHTWTTVIAGINSCVYLEEVYDNSSGDRVTRQRKITLEAKQYTISTLAAQLQSKFNAGTFLSGSPYSWTFDAEQGKLSVQVAGASANSVARLLPMDFLQKNPAYFTSFYGETVGFHDSADLIIGLTQQIALAHTDTSPTQLEHVSMNPYHILYLNCDQGLGTGEDSIGVMGNSTVLRSIPVTSGYGSMLHDDSLNGKDFTLVYPGQMQTFKFRLADVYGRDVPLSMSFSFSILLEAVDELE